MKALIIFIRNPVRGRVKTRLAQTAGEDRALDIYCRLLSHTRQVAADCPADRLLFYSDFIPEQDDWPGGQFKKFLQKGDDLGERMARAFAVALSEHRPAVIIGSDCAELNASILEEAFSQLEHFDTVIGPASDGGYYLLGMNAFHPELFRGIAWSTPEVGARTLYLIQKAGLSCHQLPTLPDIDTEEDWIQYGFRL